MRPQLALTLPGHIAVEKFERVVLTAVNNNPDLVSADRRSFFNACVRAAQDGLLPDAREGVLTIFKNKDNQKLVQWMPMVFGIMKKVRQSGQIDSMGARIVYQKEIDAGRFKFVIEDGQEKLYHDPMLWGERGPMVLVYAYARFAETGHVEYAPLHKDDVMKRKAMSKALKGPWQDWEREMWLKTAIRALAPKLPLSAELLTSITRNEEPTVTAFDRMKQDALLALGAPTGDAIIEEEEEEIEELQIDPDAFLTRAVAGLADPDVQTKDDLTEFAVIMRQNFLNLGVDDDKKAAMLGQFNTAYLEQLRKL